MEKVLPVSEVVKSSGLAAAGEAGRRKVFSGAGERERERSKEKTEHMTNCATNSTLTP